MLWLFQLPWDTLPLPAPSHVQSAKPIFSIRSVSSRNRVSPERRGVFSSLGAIPEDCSKSGLQTATVLTAVPTVAPRADHLIATPIFLLQTQQQC